MADLIEILLSATTEFYSPLVATFNGIELVFSAGIFELYVPRLSLGNTMINRYDYTIDFDGRPLSGETVKFFVGHLFNAHMIFIKDRPDHFAKHHVIDCLNMYKFIDMYLLPLAARGSNHNKHNYIGNDEHHKAFDHQFVLYKKYVALFMMLNYQVFRNTIVVYLKTRNIPVSKKTFPMFQKHRIRRI